MQLEWLTAHRLGPAILHRAPGTVEHMDDGQCRFGWLSEDEDNDIGGALKRRAILRDGALKQRVSSGVPRERTEEEGRRGDRAASCWSQTPPRNEHATRIQARQHAAPPRFEAQTPATRSPPIR